MQQRSNNDPGQKQQPTHVHITFVLIKKTRSITNATAVQQRSRTEPPLQNVNSTLVKIENQDPAQTQERSSNDPGPNPHPNHVNITMV